MNTTEDLEIQLSTPSKELVNTLKSIDGDILILGVAGKMGPSLAKLAKRAIQAGHIHKEIIGAARFSNKETQSELDEMGIKTLSGDLMDENFLQSLPEVKNVIFMAGTKFGTVGNEHFTWAMNAYLPGRVAEKFRNSRIIVFSTGNVYPYVPIGSGGATENLRPNPLGEYGQSCLGRERVFEYFSRKHGTPALMFRLNYAIDLRYGVLFEIAKAVWENSPVDLTTGHVNVIWQGDANEIALRSLTECNTPPLVLNVTGPETVSVKWVAEKFGSLMNKTPMFINEPNETALLSNASKAMQLFGYPKVTLGQMIEWTAEWIQIGGAHLGKPTHFQERSGNY